MTFNDIDAINAKRNPKIEPNKLNIALKLSNRKKSIWFNLGVAYKKLKLYEKSIMIFKYILQIEPNNIDVLNELGYVYFKIHEYNRAIEIFKKICYIDPNNRKVWKNLYRAYIKKGEFYKASKLKAHSMIIKSDLFNN